MNEFLRSNWSDIVAHVAQHVWLVLISTAIAIAIALPLGILITRRKRLRGPLLGIANVMQTIPSLALFGFLIPLPFIGGIGPRTAIIALVFYALLPIIRNTVTGILGVDRNVREAAVAMGMTDRQVLFQVELPLAMSVILTGVRVAVVITIGVAIIAAEVSAGGLGEYIFRGLRMDDTRLLLAGAVPSALMALIADFGFSAIERRFDPSARSGRAGGPGRTVAWAALLIGVVLMSYSAWRGMKSRASSSLSHGHVTVGSKDFTESNLLAEIVAQMRLNLKTISQAAAYTPQWSAGFGQDFMSRADGYAGFSQAYGLRFADPPHEMALDLTYTALASHKVDLIAGNSTDGRIAALDLVQLEDDRHYFPPYEAVFLVRKDTLMRVPALAEVLQRLSGAISTDEMRNLNYEVDGRKRDKRNVVREWLKLKGFD